MARSSPQGHLKNSNKTRPDSLPDIGRVGRSWLPHFVVIEWLHGLIATFTGWCRLSECSQRWKLYRKCIEGVGETMLMKLQTLLFKSPMSAFLSSLSSVVLAIKVSHTQSWTSMLTLSIIYIIYLMMLHARPPNSHLFFSVYFLLL